MKKSVWFSIGLMLVLVACSNEKKNVGFEQPPPASGPQPAPQQGRPPQQTQRPPQGGINNGPTTVPQTPATPSTPAQPIGSSTNTGTVVLGPWYPPVATGTVAETWLQNSLNPMMESLSVESPQALPLSAKVTITLALGYFDDIGFHDPLDPFLRSALQDVLTRECRGNNQLCGFKLRHVTGVEAYYRREGLDGILQDVRVISGALTTTHEQNLARKEDQKARSKAVEAAFLASLKDSNLVVYIGHARAGAGPDFAVPKLNSKGKVDLAGLLKEKAAAKKLLKALRSAGNRAQGLVFLADDSTTQLNKDLQKASKSIQTVTLKNALQAKDLAALGAASMELFLRQAKLKGLQDFTGDFSALSEAVELNRE